VSGNIQAIAPYRQCNAVLLCWHARLVACLDQWAVFVEGSARCSLTVSGWHMMDLPRALYCVATQKVRLTCVLQCVCAGARYTQKESVARASTSV
jgi:hypothetical protein